LTVSVVDIVRAGLAHLQPGRIDGALSGRNHQAAGLCTLANSSKKSFKSPFFSRRFCA
jgi:hypothetical protein